MPAQATRQRSILRQLLYQQPTSHQTLFTDKVCECPQRCLWCLRAACSMQRRTFPCSCSQHVCVTVHPNLKAIGRPSAESCVMQASLGCGTAAFGMPDIHVMPWCGTAVRRSHHGRCGSAHDSQMGHRAGAGERGKHLATLLCCHWLAVVVQELCAVHGAPLTCPSLACEGLGAP
jgi:hypothetical protein